VDEGTFCPVQEAIQLLEGKWVLLIIRELIAGPKGFNELARAVGGCNPATLSQRLENLAQRGIVKRTVLNVMPPKSLYSLTPAGEALDGVVASINEWATAHLRPGPDDRPVCIQRRVGPRASQLGTRA